MPEAKNIFLKRSSAILPSLSLELFTPCPWRSSNLLCGRSSSVSCASSGCRSRLFGQSKLVCLVTWLVPLCRWHPNVTRAWSGNFQTWARSENFSFFLNWENHQIWFFQVLEALLFDLFEKTSFSGPPIAWQVELAEHLRFCHEQEARQVCTGI